MGEAFVSLRNCQGAWLGPALILGVDVNKIVQILLYVECLRSSSLKNIPFKNINMKIKSTYLVRFPIPRQACYENLEVLLQTENFHWPYTLVQLQLKLPGNQPLTGNWWPPSKIVLHYTQRVPQASSTVLNGTCSICSVVCLICNLRKKQNFESWKLIHWSFCAIFNLFLNDYFGNVLKFTALS